MCLSCLSVPYQEPTLHLARIYLPGAFSGWGNISHCPGVLLCLKIWTSSGKNIGGCIFWGMYLIMALSYVGCVCGGSCERPEVNLQYHFPRSIHFVFLILRFMYIIVNECFTCMYVHHMCAVPVQIRRGGHNPGTGVITELLCGCWK